MLTRAAIFAAEDLKSEIIGVPEWGGSVKVQEMSGALRIRWENAVAGLGADAGLKILGALVVCSVVDESGEPLFTDADIDALGKKSTAALTRVYNAATKVSGLRPADLDNAVKN
jgi:hypothetical protein